MKILNAFFITSLILLSALKINAQSEDAEGCTDYHLFNRMPGFKIIDCEYKEFDAYPFPIENTTDGDVKTETVEGKYYHCYYELNDQKKDEGVTISALQIFRNFENAMKQGKMTVVAKCVESGNSYSFITFKVAKNNMEIWGWLTASESNYTLNFIEKESMVQVIQANEMLDALNNDGFIALDILFDTGKSVVKEESFPIIEQIYNLLNTNPSLNISIEGHTDNIGSPESNKSLSDSRAISVKNALISKGIDKNRLSSVGWGQERPVADNRTEDGRTKNRRVELVKK